MDFNPKLREALVKTLESELFRKRETANISFAYRLSQKYCPNTMLLLHEMSAAFGLSEIDVFATWYEECWDGTQGCTDFVVRGEDLSIYHTNDGDEGDICCVQNLQGNLILMNGGRPSAALSRYGLVFSGNQTDSNDTQVGIPRCVLYTEALLTASNLKDAVRVLQHPLRASSYHHLLSDTSGVVLSLEASATEHSLIQVTSPYFVHTNHYLRLSEFEGRQGESLEETKLRYSRVSHLLQKEASPNQILSTHGKGGVCRHGEISTSLYCVFHPLRRKVLWRIGRPCGV